eukprot:8639383-Ditylum_brightwellii.AAC.1
MRDASFVIQQLYNLQHDDVNDDGEDDEGTKKRQSLILEQIQNHRGTTIQTPQQPILPVVVGGTMMYLQWLVHGRPDAMKPSSDALAKASEMISTFQNMGDDEANNNDSGDNDTNEQEVTENNKGWEEAVKHVSSFGPIFQSRVDKLCGKDWYRLRRTLEVAYTVTELQKQNNNNNNKKEDDISKELEFYTGQRSGGLLSSGPDDTPKYDVR